MNMIDLVMSDTWLTPDQGTTAGSQSIKTNFAGALRRGCAEARQALIDMGAKKLGVPANTLVTQGRRGRQRERLLEAGDLRRADRRAAVQDPLDRAGPR